MKIGLYCPISKKAKKIGGKTLDSKANAQESQNLRNSGPTPVARGGSGAKAPPLAARPRQRWQAGCWLHQCVLRNTLAGSKTWILCPGMTLYDSAIKNDTLKERSENAKKKKRKEWKEGKPEKTLVKDLVFSMIDSKLLKL